MNHTSFFLVQIYFCGRSPKKKKILKPWKKLEDHFPKGQNINLHRQAIPAPILISLLNYPCGQYLYRKAASNYLTYRISLDVMCDIAEAEALCFGLRLDKAELSHVLLESDSLRVMQLVFGEIFYSHRIILGCP